MENEENSVRNFRHLDTGRKLLNFVCSNSFDLVIIFKKASIIFAIQTENNLAGKKSLINILEPPKNLINQKKYAMESGSNGNNGKDGNNGGGSMPVAATTLAPTPAP